MTEQRPPDWMGEEEKRYWWREMYFRERDVKARIEAARDEAQERADSYLSESYAAMRAEAAEAERDRLRKALEIAHASLAAALDRDGPAALGPALTAESVLRSALKDSDG